MHRQFRYMLKQAATELFPAHPHLQESGNVCGHNMTSSVDRRLLLPLTTSPGSRGNIAILYAAVAAGSHWTLMPPLLLEAFPLHMRTWLVADIAPRLTPRGGLALSCH